MGPTFFFSRRKSGGRFGYADGSTRLGCGAFGVTNDRHMERDLNASPSLSHR